MNWNIRIFSMPCVILVIGEGEISIFVYYSLANQVIHYSIGEFALFKMIYLSNS